MHRPLRLNCSKDALVANWRWLAKQSGVRCGAAVKADGYGLGAREVAQTLADAGCRDFFVSSWWEAAQIAPFHPGLSFAVLHGVSVDDLAAAGQSTGRPVLNTAQQVARWKELAPGRPCDVMIDTGMNRLGLRPSEADLLDDLVIDTLHSHLACADEDHAANRQQLERFRAAAAQVSASRYSLANSAGILLGREYAFDLVRPGLALYGGTPRQEACGHIQPVIGIEAQVVQRRTIPAGETCGYGGDFKAKENVEAAIVNIGYADGYWRSFSGCGSARRDGIVLPVLGRVSMDLLALGCDDCPVLAEGDWITIDFELRQAAELSRMSQYELLTGLGQRFDRRWH